jgi:Right handed beta helix region
MTGRIRFVLALAFAGGLAFAASARADDRYVDPGNAGCSDAVATSSPAVPWCSPAPALRLARPGDVVHLASGIYRQQLRPLVSGTPGHPISFVATGVVTIAPPEGTVGVMLAHVRDLVLRGLTVRANATQGIALDDAQRVTLDSDVVTNSGGVGVWIKHGSAISLRRCRLVDSARAGLFDSQYATGTVVRHSTISGNGIDGRRYDGDGIELNGAHATVQGNSITGNGDSVGLEHGIYVGRTSAGFTITENRISGNAGADIKATGGAGMISYNRLGSGLYGIVLSDQRGLVTAEYNLVQGRFQHAIFLTTGDTPARARLWNNTVRQTGRSTSAGDASAVFVASAAQLVLRNNLLTYTGVDALGSALFVNDAGLLASLDSQTNWFSSTDTRGRNLAWNGSRVSLADWRTRSLQDGASIDSSPPSFDASGQVTSDDLGAAGGTRLGLPHDLVGINVPTSGPPDIGAFETPPTGI